MWILMDFIGWRCVLVAVRETSRPIAVHLTQSVQTLLKLLGITSTIRLFVAG